MACRAIVDGSHDAQNIRAMRTRFDADAEPAEQYSTRSIRFADCRTSDFRRRKLKLYAWRRQLPNGDEFLLLRATAVRLVAAPHFKPARRISGPIPDSGDRSVGVGNLVRPVRNHNSNCHCFNRPVEMGRKDVVQEVALRYGAVSRNVICPLSTPVPPLFLGLSLRRRDSDFRPAGYADAATWAEK